MILSLAACGGGGTLDRDDNTGGQTPDTELSIALTVTDNNGQNNNVLSANEPLTITATVTDSTGAAVANEDVSFELTNTAIANFSGSISIVATDSNGVASVVLTVGDAAGSGFVTATVDGDTTEQIGINSTGNEQTVIDPASLEFYATTTQLASSGSDQIELIAVVKNEANVLLEGVDVSFSVDSGELQITQASTAADGTARAILTSNSNPQNRTISAQARTGDLIQNLSIDVVGTNISINGPSSVIINDPVPLTIILANSDGNGIAQQQLTLTAERGTLSNATPTTGPNGQVQVMYTATESGEGSVTAQALNANGSIAITVQQDEFSFTTLPADDTPLGQSAILTVTWLRDGSPFSGGTVAFTSSRGSLSSSSVVTNAQGEASVSISSSNAGIASISAEGTDGVGDIVTSRAQIEFIATEPDSIIVDASPDSIGPDGQTSTITAVVRDAQGNLVKGETVNFIIDDVSGGFISPNTATTDSRGIASTVYTSNTVSVQEDIVITAEVASDQAVSDSTVLTVGDRAFDITLGTGNSIQVPDDSTYLKEFAVFVTDNSANPVEGAQLTTSATPVKFSQGGVYRKGRWVWNGDIYVPEVSATCNNEDVNGNGMLDPGEDTNNDGLLTPGIVASASDSLVTDSNGQATLQIRYPQAFAAWADITIKVSGQSAGTEAVQSQEYTLAISSDDIDDVEEQPVPSPFGTGTSCTDNK
ncbi:Ig-like domain-containing protein [Aestuariibacter halophilus]|uniref:Ig-like domain-containing protein n=2 Tax=Fluctibacter halophilus TaxID=226011 RepID=A0ABS8G5C2_9ALTE|nr:Ig-like domain-containing protein [Aestuariibacter halophilus]